MARKLDVITINGPEFEARRRELQEIAGIKQALGDSAVTSTIVSSGVDKLTEFEAGMVPVVEARRMAGR